MSAPLQCVPCSAYDLLELDDGQWALICQDHPNDRILFDTRAHMLEWIGIMMEHEKGPWHMHVSRENHESEVFCGIDHEKAEELADTG